MKEQLWFIIAVNVVISKCLLLLYRSTQYLSWMQQTTGEQLSGLDDRMIPISQPLVVVSLGYTQKYIQCRHTLDWVLVDRRYPMDTTEIDR